MAHVSHISERQRERECFALNVCVCERGREQGEKQVGREVLKDREKGKERQIVWVCEGEREREKKRERERERERESERERKKK